MVVVFIYVKFLDLEGVLKDCILVEKFCRKCDGRYLSFGDKGDIGDKILEK